MGVQSPAAMPSPASVNHSPPIFHQLPRLAPQEMIELSFEEAVKKFACHHVVTTAGTPAATTTKQQVCAGQVSNTGKELWQSLAQKRSPSYTKSAVPDADKSSSKEAEVTSDPASVTKDGSESGDGSCNTLMTPVTKQTKAAVERTPETGAGDAKSAVSEERLPVTGWAGWQSVNQNSPVKPDEESVCSSLDAGLVDTGDVSGEDSFYSVTSGDQSLLLPTQSPIEPADEAPADDQLENSADVNNDGSHVNPAPADNAINGRNLSNVSSHCSSECRL